MDIETISFTIISGVFVGMLAGLFGVGGGIIVVPVLTFIYKKLGFPNEIIAHSAIGTSLATIFFTSFSSLYTHHKKKAVLWKILWILIPGIILGAYGGSLFASTLKSKYLIGVFIFFIFLFSGKMLFSKKKSEEASKAKMSQNPNALVTTDVSDSDLKFSSVPKELAAESESFSIARLPSKLVQSIIGILIGFSSALVGVGGGVFTSSYLLYYRTPIHLAIGTSAAIGFPIAIAGTISYMVTGWNHELLPEGSLGFIYLPALLGIVIGSVPFAYLGASLSHRLDKELLKKIFAIFLICMGVGMMVM